MKPKTITMASSSRFPRPTLYREGDSQILTVPVWKDNKTLAFLSVFMAFLLVTWIHGFLQPILSEWRGAQSTLSHGQKVSGWIWTLVLLGLPYYALYQWKGRLVLIAGPDRLLWIRDMVLFRIRREYLGMYIRNLRWSMPEKLPMPFRMQAVQVTNGSILCDYQGRTVMLTGVIPAQFGKSFVDALVQVYATARERHAETNLEEAKLSLPSKRDIQVRNGTLRVVRSGRNVRLAWFMTLFLVVWSFFEKFIVFVVLHDSVSTVGAVTGSRDLLHIVMMRIFLAFWSLVSIVMIPHWLFIINGWEELELDDVSMCYRKRFILFSYSRRFLRQVVTNFRITDTGVGAYQSAKDRQNRAFWGESSLALAYDVASKTKRIFIGASQEEFDVIAEALARIQLNLAKPDSVSRS